MHRRVREALRVGHCGPVARRLARAVMRSGVPGRELLAFGVLGKPRGRPVELAVERNGIVYALDLREDSHRLMFLGIYETSLIERALRFVPVGGRVVDVGANVGFWTLPAAMHVGQDGAVVALEPNPWARDKLLENLALNRARPLAHVEVVGSAVGAARATAALTAPDLEAQAAQATLHAAAGTEDVLQSVEVEVVPLDEVVSAPIDLLKIDVEGHEPAVLDGAAQLLATAPPKCLVVEVHGENLARAGTSPEALVSRIESLGYVAVASDGEFAREGMERPLPPDFFETIIWESQAI